MKHFVIYILHLLLEIVKSQQSVLSDSIFVESLKESSASKGFDDLNKDMKILPEISNQLENVQNINYFKKVISKESCAVLLVRIVHQLLLRLCL